PERRRECIRSSIRLEVLHLVGDGEGGEGAEVGTGVVDGGDGIEIVDGLDATGVTAERGGEKAGQRDGPPSCDPQDAVPRVSGEHPRSLRPLGDARGKRIEAVTTVKRRACLCRKPFVSRQRRRSRERPGRGLPRAANAPQGSPGTAL